MTSCTRHRDCIELEISEVADDLLRGPTSSPPSTRRSSGKAGPVGLEEPGLGEGKAARRADGEGVHRRIISHTVLSAIESVGSVGMWTFHATAVATDSR